MKMNFEYFQIQKWMLQTMRTEKADEKNAVVCLVSVFPSWVMVLKLSKKEHFLKFCAELSKKSKSIKAMYVYEAEKSRYARSAMVLFIMPWLNVLKILLFEIEAFC